jgi:hypothetical protein
MSLIFKLLFADFLTAVLRVLWIIKRIEDTEPSYSPGLDTSGTLPVSI